MKKKNANIEKIMESTSKTRVCEKRPVQHSLIVFIFCLVFALLVFCFVNDEFFSINQMSFLGIFGASVISVFTIFLTLNHQKRSDYIAARKSALMLSEILDSLYSQIERIKNGSVYTIVYPIDWIRYYENCCTYLKYDYLPYLLREFDIAEKLNKCIENDDKSGIERLLNYRKASITDWTFDFTIISAKTNLSLFASGNSEFPPWKQEKQHQGFKNFIIENYSNEIKRLTIEYLQNNNGQCDATKAEYFVMEQLRTEKALQTGTYRYIALENKAMLNAIFAVYLSLKPEDTFELCWGELSLKASNKEK